MEEEQRPCGRGKEARAVAAVEKLVGAWVHGDAAGLQRRTWAAFGGKASVAGKAGWARRRRDGIEDW
ncbi:hypothetical protein M0R45_026340 [Rubus argutus]|uniref:Uncharacterized protein n=1 Tax=Rubus argutus TaxID=59490 RepID=A0AAW1WZK2_RUBAR